MARIEHSPTDKKAEPSKDKQRWWSRFFKTSIIPKSCFGRALFSLIIVICFILALIAYLGIIDIPIFSDLFFRPIQPIRRVEPSADKIDDIGSVIANKMIEYAQASNSGLFISEEELTILIQKALASDPEMPLKNMQAAVEHEGIELFGEIFSESRSYHFSIMVMPYLDQEEVNIRIVKARLERLPIPAPIVNALLGQMLNQPLEELNANMLEYFNLVQLEPQGQKVLLEGQVINTQLPF